MIAIDVSKSALGMAAGIGAEHCILASDGVDVVGQIRVLSDGGVHLSMDALGNRITCFNSIECLRKRGKHVQVGLMSGDNLNPAIPMHLVVANELEILGSHGMQAHQYKFMLEMIADGRLNPGALIGQTVGLRAAAKGLGTEEFLQGPGVSVIDRFGDDDV